MSKEKEYEKKLEDLYEECKLNNSRDNLIDCYLFGSCFYGLVTLRYPDMPVSVVYEFLEKKKKKYFDDTEVKNGIFIE